MNLIILLVAVIMPIVVIIVAGRENRKIRNFYKNKKQKETYKAMQLFDELLKEKLISFPDEFKK